MMDGVCVITQGRCSEESRTRQGLSVSIHPDKETVIEKCSHLEYFEVPALLFRDDNAFWLTNLTIAKL